MNQPKNINVSQRNRRIDSESKLVSYIKTQLGAPLITVDVTDDQILQCVDDAFDKFVDWAYDAQQHQVFIIETQEDIQDYILDDRVREIYDISIADTTTSYASSGGSGISLGGFGQVPVNYIPYIDMEGNVSSLETGASAPSMASGVAGGVSGPNTSNEGLSETSQAWAKMVDAHTLQNMFGSSVSYDFNSQNHILRIFKATAGKVAIEAALEYIPNPDYDDMYGHTWIKAYSLALTKRVWSNNIGKYSQSLVGGAELNYDRIGSEAQEALDKLEEDLIEKYSEALGIFSA